MIRFICFIVLLVLVWHLADIALSDEKKPTSAKAQFNACYTKTNEPFYCVTGLKVGF